MKSHNDYLCCPGRELELRSRVRKPRVWLMSTPHQNHGTVPAVHRHRQARTLGRLGGTRVSGEPPAPQLGIRFSVHQCSRTVTPWTAPRKAKSGDAGRQPARPPLSKSPQSREERASLEGMEGAQGRAASHPALWPHACRRQRPGPPRTPRASSAPFDPDTPPRCSRVFQAPRPGTPRARTACPPLPARSSASGAKQTHLPCPKDVCLYNSSNTD